MNLAFDHLQENSVLLIRHPKLLASRNQGRLLIRVVVEPDFHFHNHRVWCDHLPYHHFGLLPQEQVAVTITNQQLAITVAASSSLPSQHCYHCYSISLNCYSVKLVGATLEVSTMTEILMPVSTLLIPIHHRHRLAVEGSGPYWELDYRTHSRHRSRRAALFTSQN